MENLRCELDYGFNFGGRKALHSAALTHSCLTETALDALWYNMSSLAPLFKLLCNFELEYQENVSHIFNLINKTS
jgi:hypothetical protein